MIKLHEFKKQVQKPTLIIDETMIDCLIHHHFHPQERFLGLYVSPDKTVLLLNELFPYANDELEIIRFKDTDDPSKLVMDLLEGSELLCDKRLSVSFYLNALKHCPELKIEIDSLADKIRSVKSPEEQDIMRQASALNDSVMAMVHARLKLGVSEREIAEFIKEEFIRQGAEGVSFDPVVAFGDNAAEPHASYTDRKLAEGEAIIIDMGCIYQSYCSDMTRTYFLKENKMQEVYDTVRMAQATAVKAIKPGIKLKDIDKIARSMIEEKGYGPYFTHRLGHFIGRSIHEPYDVSATSDIEIEEGMIFTVEPGVYLPGVGGVRIEDTVLVTKDGVESLNSFTKDEIL